MSTTILEVYPTPPECIFVQVRVGEWYDLNGDPVKVRALRTYHGQPQAEVGRSFRALWVPCSFLTDYLSTPRAVGGREGRG